MIEAEKQDECDRLLDRLERETDLDLEAVEFYVRSAMLAAGATVLEKLLEPVGAGRRSERLACECGEPMESVGRRTKRLRTVLGAVRFRRSLYRCPACGATRIPGDEAVGLVGTVFSPGVRRLMARAGSRTPFAEAAEDLHVYAHIDVSAKEVERVAEQLGRQMADWMERESSRARCYAACDSEPPDADEPVDKLYVSFDGTGVPMRREELRHTRGKGPDGRAKTREVKLGCVFTQTTLDDQGRPVRDPASTTYVGAIENSVAFGYRIWGEAVRRGLGQAQRVALLTDGAAYNKTIAAEHFPDAVHIIDLYHAREHLANIVKQLPRVDTDGTLHTHWRELLDSGNIEALLDAVRTQLPRTGARRKALLKQMRYFQDNAALMRYADFRSQGLFVGSGVVEAGCKTLIGKRLKGSGMFWTVRGANAIIASRCCQYSGRFEQFWEDQAA
jgi:hypothetical protein